MRFHVQTRIILSAIFSLENFKGKGWVFGNLDSECFSSDEYKELIRMVKKNSNTNLISKPYMGIRKFTIMCGNCGYLCTDTGSIKEIS